MRRHFLYPAGLPAALALILLAVAGAPLAAQQPDSAAAVALDSRALPRDIARRAEELHARAVIRATQRLSIDSGRVVQGEVSVQNGPLVLGGHVQGSVLAVNADVQLLPGARIDGDLLVVGGEVTGLDQARVDGEMRAYRAPVRLSRADARRDRDRERDRDRRDSDDEAGDSWWGSWDRDREGNTWTDFHVSSAGAYNRVEGLPVKLGPRIRQAVGADGQLRLDAFAIARTGSSFRDDSSDVGYDILAEVRAGRSNGLSIGGRLFDVNSPVEAWQLSELEAGLASFLARRDYRDYFGRHGGQLVGRAYSGENVSLELTFSDERWRSRNEENPFSLFKSGRAWRPNPMMDAGRFHVMAGGLRIDTRNDEDNPWSGWYMTADLERGSGRLTEAALVAPELRAAPAAGERQTYARGLLDLRRYNRLGPNAQLNMRAVLGGWLAGDALPVQRRLSVDGPGALPGFGFRREREGVDLGTCNTSSFRLPGHPALCERIALAQVEYRNDLYVSVFEDWGVDFSGDAEWVMFADAGRGWLLREHTVSGGYGTSELPALDSFRADVGLGLDFDAVGIYIAKAVTAGAEPPVLFLRVRHRF